MNKEFIKKEWLYWIILISPFIYLAFEWNDLPDRMPIHWNAHGEANGFGSKVFGGLFMPLLNIGLYALFLALPKIDPKKRNYESFGKTYRILRLGLCLFFAVIYIIIIQITLGNHFINEKWIAILVCALIAFLGNYLRTVRPNWFVGIRTPWTLASPEVWKRTHEAGGRLLFYAGLLGIILECILSADYSWIPVALVIATALFSVAYSFVLFKKLERNAGSA